ncbi:MAG: YtxH domain-containing protein [Saprospiraceae bacterium]|jgi:gas vesicle protein|nr:YtxH domain-containing protein [Saprospiraceae bacterium]
MSNNSESNMNGWIFLAGLATGAVVGYMLNTDRGRQLRHEAADKAADYGNQARHYASDKYSNVASTVSSIIDKGKSYAAEVSQKLQQEIKEGSEIAQDTLEEAENAFQRGANKAKSHLRDISAS